MRQLEGLPGVSSEHRFRSFSLTQEVFDTLAAASSARGGLTHPAFRRSLERLLPDPASASTAALLERLFTAFDTESSAFISAAELTAGLTVLCGGAPEDKVG